MSKGLKKDFLETAHFTASLVQFQSLEILNLYFSIYTQHICSFMITCPKMRESCGNKSLVEICIVLSFELIR